MQWRRCAAEFTREAARPSSIGVVAGYCGLTGAFALGAAEDHVFLWWVPFVLAPLLLAPFAARLVARDRERAASQLLAATPLTRAEWLTAKAIFLGALLVACILCSVPVVAAAVSNAGAHALGLNAPRFAWALALGAAAAGAGLFLGALAGPRSTAGLSAAFVLVIAWVGLAESASEIVAATDTRWGRAVALHVVHLSPATWAYDNLSPVGYTLRLADGGPPALVGPLVLAGTALAGTYVVAARLQRADGSFRPLGGRIGALAALGALAVAAVAGPAVWTLETGESRGPDVWSSADGLTLDYQGVVSQGSGVSLWDVRDGDVVALTITAKAPSERDVTVTELRVESREITFEVLDPPPYVAHLRERGGAQVYDHLRVRMRAQVGYAGVHVPITLHLVADGEPAVLGGLLLSRPASVPIAPVVAAAGLATAAMTALALNASRRLNAW